MGAGLEKIERRLQSRAPLIGAWLRRRALRRLAGLGTPGACRMLARTVAYTGDHDTRHKAFVCLRDMARKGSKPAREALCRLVINSDYGPARDLVLAEKYQPEEEIHRALYFFMTSQWEAYEALDFDHHMLRTAYSAVSQRLRDRIAAQARSEGRLEWVDIASGGQQGKRLGTMTDAEWKMVIALLRDEGHMPELWKLAQEAPPRWAGGIVRCLAAEEWAPAEADVRDFRELAGYAKACHDLDTSLLFQFRRSLEGHTDEVRALTFLSDGRTLASGSADRTVRIWDAKAGKCLHVLAEHRGAINCLAVSPDGKQLVSGGKDGLPLLWRLTANPVAIALDGHEAAITNVTFSSDGQWLATADGDGALQLWSALDGSSRATLTGHEGAILAMQMTPNGGTLVTGAADGLVRLWDVPTGRLHNTLAAHDSEPVPALAISPEGDLLAAAAGKATYLYRLPTGQPLGVLLGHREGVNCLAFSPDGQILLGGGADHEVLTWRISDAHLLHRVEAHSSQVTQVLVDPRGKIGMSVSGYGAGHDYSIRLWSLADGSLQRALYGHTRYISSVAQSADGQYLASGGGDCTIRIWSSELSRLNHVPVGQISLADLEYAEQCARDEHSLEAERAAWGLIACLVRRRRRTDIELDDAGRRSLRLGPYDIEIG
jgi:WD40 repeat protein